MLHDKARSAGFVFSPPWMAGMPEMQEQFPASAMDGGDAGNAGAISGGAWMAQIPKTKEFFLRCLDGTNSEIEGASLRSRRAEAIFIDPP